MSFCHPSLFKALKIEQLKLAEDSIVSLFQSDHKRAENFSLEAVHLLLDYSKNLIDIKALSLLIKLAHEVNLKSHINHLLAGKFINQSENRLVLHTALRQQTDQPLYVNGQNSIDFIRSAQAKMALISNTIRSKKWLGITGRPIEKIINLGVGGSDLGPRFVTQALQQYAHPTLSLAFISNIDPEPLIRLLETLNPETTLFIISSKSFTTQETLVNTETARHWLEAKLGPLAIKEHMLAITEKTQKALDYGIPENHILPLWDWVGGRYSLWSTMGLPIAISIGMDNFYKLLQGAHRMDEHFQQAPFEKNMPVLLALLSIWSINFFNAPSQAIIPYSEALSHLPSYLQQLEMESNGKSVDQNGEILDYHTAPIIWGGVGTNSQHACHQLFHQGTGFVPVDFIVSLKANHTLQNHQDILFSNCLAQSQALMQGQTEEEVRQKLINEGMDTIQASTLAKHKQLRGSKPSNIIVLEEINPESLGALIALYEHKIFVQGIIWNINSFDQWGVELGKQLDQKILDTIHGKMSLESHDPSTQILLNRYISTLKPAK
jgi:glucose-6-phosphate isomerase